MILDPKNKDDWDDDLRNLEPCDCDRKGCDFADHSGANTVSYSKDDVKVYIEWLQLQKEYLVKLLKDNK